MAAKHSTLRIFSPIPLLCLHTHTLTHSTDSPPSPLCSLLFPFPSLSFWHPSLSVAMDCETNFYHYTLQVKKGSWECVIYAGFDFYVASMGSSIIALLGTLVHWAPDEMLSWHRYQSPYACPSPVPAVQEGACVVAAGLPPLLLPLPLLCLHDGDGNSHIHLSTEMVHLEHVLCI